MTDRVRANIAEEAAEWFVANRERSQESVQRATFAAWLKTSPVHVEEYLEIALLARDLREAAADPSMSLEELLTLARSPSDSNVRPIRTDNPTAVRETPSFRWHHAAAAAATLAAAALGFLWWSSDRTSEVRFATRHGEQITERLADSSVLHLDTDTVVTVRYTRARRLVEVERGQVLFEVAHEASRAFEVIAGAAEVVDVGTTFDVYLQRDSTLVSVMEGQVTVGLAPGPHGAIADSRTVSVHAGEQVRVADGALPAQAARADLQRNAAWLRREIIFEREPLATVAAEFSRYSATPIEIESPALRKLAISGSFSADDTESFIAFLKSMDGVRVEVTPTRIRVRSM